jgi:hypothetical protein
VIISVVYLLVRCLLGCLMILTRHRVSKDAELLVLRLENAGRQGAGRPAEARPGAEGQPVRAVRRGALPPLRRPAVPDHDRRRAAPDRLPSLFRDRPGPQVLRRPMIRLAAAEALADEVLGNRLHPVCEIREVPANEAEIDDQLAALDYERRQVALRGLSWEAEDAERARIRAECERVSATERIPSRPSTRA